MELKKGVKITNLTTQMLLGIKIAEYVYQKYGYELVITSADDSVHGKTTKHGSGNAVDYRTSFLKPGEAEIITKEIKERCDESFDVIFEGDHIHHEYDPHI